MKDGDIMAYTIAYLIKKDLKDQLEAQDKIGKYYEDLVDDYISFYQLKKKLKQDIKDNGLRYKTTNGNGIAVEKANESILNLTKVNTQMLKILSDLNLQKPVITNPNPDDENEQLL